MTLLNVLRGEISKVRTLRPLVLAIALTIVLTLAYCVIEARPELGLSTPDTAGVYALANLSFFPAITGVLVVSSEYSGGQLTTTALTVPRRGRVLTAKLLIAAALTTVLGLLLAVFIATIVQIPLADQSVWATEDAGPLLSSLALGVASWTAFGVLSACAAFLVRSQTVVLAATVVLTFGGFPLMMAVPVFQYLPANAGVLMYLNREQQTSDWLIPPDVTVSGAAITVAAWCTLAIIAAAVAFLRRDIGARHAAIE